MEWLAEHAWVAWLCLSLSLGAAEMLTLDLTLMMLAVGALAGGVTAFVLPGMVLAQVVVAVVVALLSLFILRPPLLARVRNTKGYRNSMDTMVGSEGMTVRVIEPGRTGEVLVNGDTWTARAWSVDIGLRPGDRVEVVEVDGVTAVVRPVPELTP